MSQVFSSLRPTRNGSEWICLLTSDRSASLIKKLASTATATGSLATVIGPNASTAAANAVAIRSGSVANEQDSLPVGAPGNQRRIHTNVAAGITPTDAATVG